jgi:transposase
VSSAVVVHLVLQPVAMRQSMNGLTIAVVEQLAIKLQGRHLFVLCNKADDKIKVLLGDRNGFVVYDKRLERGWFYWPRAQGEAQAITAEQLKWLLAESDVMTMGRFLERLIRNNVRANESCLAGQTSCQAF